MEYYFRIYGLEWIEKKVESIRGMDRKEVEGKLQNVFVEIVLGFIESRVFDIVYMFLSFCIVFFK